MFVFVKVCCITDYNITGYLCWNPTIHGQFRVNEINRFPIKQLDTISFKNYTYSIKINTKVRLIYSNFQATDIVDHRIYAAHRVGQPLECHFFRSINLFKLFNISHCSFDYCQWVVTTHHVLTIINFLYSDKESH